MGALHLRAALRSYRSPAGSPRLARRDTLAWIIVCMVSARSAAMAFNRWADAELDAANPRTATRAIPAGLLAESFVPASRCHGRRFLLAAWRLNRLTCCCRRWRWPSSAGYSYMKRFTRWLAPSPGPRHGHRAAAAWIAVRGA